jgi:hypothetical protein
MNLRAFYKLSGDFYLRRDTTGKYLWLTTSWKQELLRSRKLLARAVPYELDE